jgi:hypothetical protein
METRDTLYVDEETLTELVLLRRLAHAHHRLKEAQHGPMNEEQQAMSSHYYGQINRILDDYAKVVRKDRERYGEAVGVVVGRFQIPELHDGHRFILETVRKRHPNFAVAIGIAHDLATIKDPLTYNMRATMIQEEFHDCVTMPIPDVKESDEVWSRNLDLAIRIAFPVGGIRLYGSRDSFIPSYHGQFPTTEISPAESWTGTQMRAKVGEEPLNNAEFRRGVIFATQVGGSHGRSI